MRPYPQNKINTSQATRGERGDSLWIEAARWDRLKAKQTTKKKNKIKNLNHGL